MVPNIPEPYTTLMEMSKISICLIIFPLDRHTFVYLFFPKDTIIIEFKYFLSDRNELFVSRTYEKITAASQTQILDRNCGPHKNKLRY